MLKASKNPDVFRSFQHGGTSELSLPLPLAVHLEVGGFLLAVVVRR
jgi:hypothetical protein